SDRGDDRSLPASVRCPAAQRGAAPHSRSAAEPARPAGGVGLEPMDDCLVGIRLRDTSPADDYRVAGDLELHVGDLVLVETSAESTIGEVRRPRRQIPEAEKDRLYRRVLRLPPQPQPPPDPHPRPPP